MPHNDELARYVGELSLDPWTDWGVGGGFRRVWT